MKKKTKKLKCKHKWQFSYMRQGMDGYWGMQDFETPVYFCEKCLEEKLGQVNKYGV